MKKSSRKKIIPRGDELKRKIKYNRNKDGFQKYKVKDYRGRIQSGGTIN
tara:strand:- start:1935 stop:2081 length:147 start_codon:yes stop_codon:yes gene_type:complete